MLSSVCFSVIAIVRDGHCTISRNQLRGLIFFLPRFVNPRLPLSSPRMEVAQMLVVCECSWFANVATQGMPNPENRIVALVQTHHTGIRPQSYTVPGPSCHAREFTSSRLSDALLREAYNCGQPVGKRTGKMRG